MGKFQNPCQADGPGRRAFLRFSVAGLVVPLGAMAPGLWRPANHRCRIRWRIPRSAAWRPRRPAVAPGSVPRELKITWNTNAVCNVGVAVADERGFFAKRNLKVEKINFAGATDQLLELLASGKADAGCRHGPGLDEAARARLRREADGGDPWRLHPADHHARVRHRQCCRR